MWWWRGAGDHDGGGSPQTKGLGCSVQRCMLSRSEPSNRVWIKALGSAAGRAVPSPLRREENTDAHRSAKKTIPQLWTMLLTEPYEISFQHNVYGSTCLFKATPVVPSRCSHWDAIYQNQRLTWSSDPNGGMHSMGTDHNGLYPTWVSIIVPPPHVSLPRTASHSRSNLNSDSCISN